MPVFSPIFPAPQGVDTDHGRNAAPRFAATDVWDHPRELRRAVELLAEEL